METSGAPLDQEGATSTGASNDSAAQGRADVASLAHNGLSAGVDGMGSSTSNPNHLLNSTVSNPSLACAWGNSNTPTTDQALARILVAQMQQQQQQQQQQNSLGLGVNPQLLALLNLGLLSTVGSTIVGADPLAQALAQHVAGQAAHHHQSHQISRKNEETNTATVAAAAANLAVAQASGNVPSGTIANAMLSNMQHWKLDQLEAHVKLLRDTKQPIPQPIAMLLGEARRKEEKRAAKRVANRKSACTSRARKKALVEEMAKANARLRRQALILSLLPDLVITVSIEGEITFCSGQVERVLRHSVDDLIGANLSELLVPTSRDSFNQLIKELVGAEHQVAKEAFDRTVEARCSQDKATKKAADKEKSCKDGDDGLLSSSVHSSAAVADQPSGNRAATDQSLPIKVVRVSSADNVCDNSDLSASVGRQGSDPPSSPKPKRSSDESFSSSSDARSLRKASEALYRNVRWHNEKMQKSSTTGGMIAAYKDDVTGAFVTANNADAKLSSLQHRADSPIEEKGQKRPSLQMSEDRGASSLSDSLVDGVDQKKSSKVDTAENSSEDSGYRESNEGSPDDEFSDSTSAIQSGGRTKPLAPTCTLCLIRDDLTTLWCEVTSSIRTRNLSEEASEETLPGYTQCDVASSSGKLPSSTRSSEEVKELLLCLRPIRDGEKMVGERYRFVPRRKETDSEGSGSAVLVSSGTSTTAPGPSENEGSKATAQQRPPKKRPLHKETSLVTEVSGSSPNDDVPATPPTKKPKVSAVGREKNAAESLILMQSPRAPQ